MAVRAPRTMTDDEMTSLESQQSPRQPRVMTDEQMTALESPPAQPDRYRMPAEDWPVVGPAFTAFNNAVYNVVNPQGAMAQAGVNPHTPGAIRNVAAGAYEGVQNLYSPLYRLGGDAETADAMNTGVGQYEQQAAALDKGALGYLGKTTRGTLGSLIPVAASGAMGGPGGAILGGVGMETNSAITEGQRMGLSGDALRNYVLRAGVIEAVPATVMQAAGMGGLESLFGAAAPGLRTGIKAAIKELGLSTLKEVPEELVTEIGHSINAKLSGVNPNALTKEALGQTIMDTTAQTVMTMGLMGGPRAARMAFAKDAPAPATGIDMTAIPGAVVGPDGKVTLDGTVTKAEGIDYLMQELGMDKSGAEARVNDVYGGTDALPMTVFVAAMQSAPGVARRPGVAVNIPEGLPVVEPQTGGVVEPWPTRLPPSALPVPEGTMQGAGPMVGAPEIDLSDPDGLQRVYQQVYGGGDVAAERVTDPWEQLYVGLLQQGMDPQEAMAETLRKREAAFRGAEPGLSDQGEVVYVPEDAPPFAAQPQPTAGPGGPLQPAPAPPQQGAQGMGPL